MSSICRELVYLVNTYNVKIVKYFVEVCKGDHNCTQM